MEEKNYINKEQDRRITVLENHLATINKELGEVKTDIAGIKKDICWIKRFIFVLLPIMAGMIVSLIYIALKLK